MDEEWVKDVIVPFTQPQEADGTVRTHAIQTRGKLWGNNERLKALLTPLAGLEEKDDRVRDAANILLKVYWTSQD